MSLFPKKTQNNFKIEAGTKIKWITFLFTASPTTSLFAMAIFCLEIAFPRFVCLYIEPHTSANFAILCKPISYTSVVSTISSSRHCITKHKHISYISLVIASNTHYPRTSCSAKATQSRSRLGGGKLTHVAESWQCRQLLSFVLFTHISRTRPMAVPVAMQSKWHCHANRARRNYSWI